jgi:hypothetical protein
MADNDAPRPPEERLPDDVARASAYEPGVDTASGRSSRATEGAPTTDATPGDPTRVREQPALRGGSAARWIVPSAILGVIAIVLFAVCIPIAAAVAWIGIALQAAFFLVLTVATLALRPSRYRSGIFAGAMIGMAASALLLLLVILGVAVSG